MATEESTYLHDYTSFLTAIPFQNPVPSKEPSSNMFACACINVDSRDDLTTNCTSPIVSLSSSIRIKQRVPQKTERAVSQLLRATGIPRSQFSANAGNTSTIGITKRQRTQPLWDDRSCHQQGGLRGSSWDGREEVRRELPSRNGQAPASRTCNVWQNTGFRIFPSLFGSDTSSCCGQPLPVAHDE